MLYESLLLKDWILMFQTAVYWNNSFLGSFAFAYKNTAKTFYDTFKA